MTEHAFFFGGGRPCEDSVPFCALDVLTIVLPSGQYNGQEDRRFVHFLQLMETFLDSGGNVLVTTCCAGGC